MQGKTERNRGINRECNDWFMPRKSLQSRSEAVWLAFLGEGLTDRELTQPSINCTEYRPRGERPLAAMRSQILYPNGVGHVSKSVAVWCYG